MEIVTLTKMLGGWGQPVANCHRESVLPKKAEYSNLSDPQYQDSYKGTPGLRWRVVPEKEVAQAASASVVSTIESEQLIPQINKTGTVDTESVVTTDAASAVPAVEPVEPTCSNIIKIATQPSLLSAWGAGGTWHEHNGSVFAPEEVFFPTVLSLLGYLNDSTASDGRNDVSTTNVKIAAVTFAEWAKKGDANPVAYEYLDAQLLQRMRSTGAVFGRKFGPNSVRVSVWCRVIEDCDAESNAQHISSSRQHSAQERYRNESNNRRDNDGYNNYSNNYHNYYDYDQHRDHRSGDYRSYNDRNYDNRNYRNDRYDSMNNGGRDYSDSKRRRY